MDMSAPAAPAEAVDVLPKVKVCFRERKVWVNGRLMPIEWTLPLSLRLRTLAWLHKPNTAISWAAQMGRWSEQTHKKSINYFANILATEAGMECLDAREHVLLLGSWSFENVPTYFELEPGMPVPTVRSNPALLLGAARAQQGVMAALRSNNGLLAVRLAEEAVAKYGGIEPTCNVTFIVHTILARALSFTGRTARFEKLIEWFETFGNNGDIDDVVLWARLFVRQNYMQPGPQRRMRDHTEEVKEIVRSPFPDSLVLLKLATTQLMEMVRNTTISTDYVQRAEKYLHIALYYALRDDYPRDLASTARLSSRLSVRRADTCALQQAKAPSVYEAHIAEAQKWMDVSNDIFTHSLGWPVPPVNLFDSMDILRSKLFARDLLGDPLYKDDQHAVNQEAFRTLHGKFLQAAAAGVEDERFAPLWDAYHCSLSSAPNNPAFPIDQKDLIRESLSAHPPSRKESKK